MVNIVGYNSDIGSVIILIKHLKQCIHCPAKGEFIIIYFKFENGNYIALDTLVDSEYILNFKKHYTTQLYAAIEILGFITIHNDNKYKVSYIDSLKNKCYKYLEVTLNLDRGVISKGD